MIFARYHLSLLSVTYFSAGESATAASVVNNRKVKLSCR